LSKTGERTGKEKERETLFQKRMDALVDKKEKGLEQKRKKRKTSS